jgi:hypothetical protein
MLSLERLDVRRIAEELSKLGLGEILYSIIQRKYDIKDSIWELSLEIPPQQTIYAKVEVPKEIVLFERGYEFDVDKLGVLTFTHYHDGRLIMKDITIDDTILSFRYSTPEICAYYFEIYVTNNDTVSHVVSVKGLYKSVPREIYDKVKIV